MIEVQWLREALDYVGKDALPLREAEAERDRYRAEAESARTTGERILADALRYRAAIEDIRAEHQDFTIPHDEALSNIGTILTRALTEGAADA